MKKKIIWKKKCGEKNLAKKLYGKMNIMNNVFRKKTFGKM